MENQQIGLVQPVYPVQNNNFYMLIAAGIVIILVILYFNNKLETEMSEIDTTIKNLPLNASVADIPTPIIELPKKISDLETRLFQRLGELDRDLDIQTELDTKNTERITVLEKRATPTSSQLSDTYIYLTLTRAITSGIGSQDRIVFNDVRIHAPNSEIVQLYGPYTKNFGIDSIGRYRLTSGTWKVTGSIGYCGWAAEDGMMNMALINADTGELLSNGISISARSFSSYDNYGTAFAAIFTLDRATRVELRIMNQKALVAIGWDSGTATNKFSTYPSLIIEKII